MTKRGGLYRLCAVVGLLILAGCTGPGNPLAGGDSAAALAKAAPSSGGTFTQNLAHEYSIFANDQVGEGDYSSADYFGKKGLEAARGQAVQPESLANWHITADKSGELAAARSRLVSALDAGGRERLPATAARAQERYDCWVEEQNEGWQLDEIAKCRSEFLAAMNELEAQPVAQAPATPQPAPSAVGQYRVYFDFDRATLTADARRIVAQAAAAAKQQPNLPVELISRADRVGTNAYNQHLSERRGQAVRDALVADGVPRDRITDRALGDRDLPVPTREGVREARNRVVDITIGTAASQ
jgi:OmpA-OmpF porin, OOP family